MEKVHTVPGNTSDLQCGERRGLSFVAGVTTDARGGAGYVCSLRTYSTWVIVFDSRANLSEMMRSYGRLRSPIGGVGICRPPLPAYGGGGGEGRFAPVVR